MVGHHDEGGGLNNLTAAIITKAASSSFLNSISGRLRNGRAEDNDEYPYCVLMLPVTGDPNSLSTFDRDYNDLLVQFSIFSALHAPSEAWTIFGYLKALYNGCALSITGETLIDMSLANIPQPIPEDHTVPGKGTQRVWHIPAEFTVVTKVG